MYPSMGMGCLQYADKQRRNEHNKKRATKKDVVIEDDSENGELLLFSRSFFQHTYRLLSSRQMHLATLSLNYTVRPAHCEYYTYLQEETPKGKTVSSSGKQTSLINYATVTKNENAKQDDSIKVSTRPKFDNQSQAMDSSVSEEQEEYSSENCPEIAYFMKHCEVEVPEWMKNKHSSHDED
jgi:hypothetical protein